VLRTASSFDVEQLVTHATVEAPCRKIPLPRIERSEMQFLAPAEIARIGDAIHGHYRTMVFTAAYTGLR